MNKGDLSTTSAPQKAGVAVVKLKPDIVSLDALWVGRHGRRQQDQRGAVRRLVVMSAGSAGSVDEAISRLASSPRKTRSPDSVETDSKAAIGEALERKGRFSHGD